MSNPTTPKKNNIYNSREEWGNEKNGARHHTQPNTSPVSGDVYCQRLLPNEIEITQMREADIILTETLNNATSPKYEIWDADPVERFTF